MSPSYGNRATYKQMGDVRKAFEATTRALERSHWINLSPDRIKLIHDSIEEKQILLHEEAKNVQIKLRNDIENNQAEDHEDDTEQFWSIKRQFNRLEQRRLIVNDRLQRQYIRTRISEKFGGQFEKNLERLVLILIIFVLSLLTYAALRTDLSDKFPFGGLWILFYFDAMACSVFLFDFFLRLHFAEDKYWFWRKNWIDLVSSIPLPPAPELQWLRVIRLLKILRAARVVALIWRGLERLESTVDVPMMKKSIMCVAIVLILGTLVIPLLEQEEANLKQENSNSEQSDSNLNQAKPNSKQAEPIYVAEVHNSAWWTFATLTTGGFADLHDPKSLPGRFFTAFIIVTGWVLVGVFTATLTNVYSGEASDDLRYGQDQLKSELMELGNLRSELQEELSDIRCIIDEIKHVRE